ncbi:GHKL domain-containing protein [candidate division WOR-3 bacterium]|uniref:histidine kinase n=1 Tax=candidate division WOR-3 bacterium TaxID=2052148 RepID=A0A9D5QD15_UNCW3|nr:GHKL domain-containing protein [candidate division WOR-3 bacterium]
MELSRGILQLANRGVSRIEFQREISKMLIEFSDCDEIELRITDGKLHYLWDAKMKPAETFWFKRLDYVQDKRGMPIPCLPGTSGIEQTCRLLLGGGFDRSSSNFTEAGSFWTGDADNIQGIQSELNLSEDFRKNGFFNSLAMIPFVIDDQNTGLMILKSKNRNFFSAKEIEFYEGVVQTLGIAIAGRRAQADLRERVKELSCVYGIAQLVEVPGITIRKILQGIADLLPPAMRYPDIASSRITLDDKQYCSPPESVETCYRLTADIEIDGETRGGVEVFYSEDKPELELELFIAEEQSLLDAVAGYVGLIVKRRQWEKEKDRLQEQLRHADRLATLGQLGAGVAHELNEPLGAILGFSQLALKTENLPAQARKDIAKIEHAAIHAREVVKKLLIFARQMPTRKSLVSLNRIVEEGLYFLESRCEKEGVELVRDLAEGLPEITADPGQLHQVLVNLVVNALQASSSGDRLTITTRAENESVYLIVEDTGDGMSEEVRRQIFVPFYTTKEVGHGTGLGLPVVHGIVTSHGGEIKIKTMIGKGSIFTVKLPLTGSPAKESSYDTTT